MNAIPRPTQKIRRKFNTPQILSSGLYTLVGISFLLLVLSIFGIRAQRQSLQTVGKDAAPSILTAQQLRDAFAGLDASLANELLLQPGENQQVLADFETNQKKIAERLVAAAKNITYPAEEPIIQLLQLQGSNYLLKLQAARDAHQRGDRVGALNIYRSAASLMDEEILPQAEQLDRVNSQELENIYGIQIYLNGAIGLLIAIVGLVQIGILIALQVFLYRRMRRIFNLPLLGASALTILLLGYTMNNIIGAASDLKVAKEDAFDSIHNLRQARALSYMAHATQSRYLLDSTDATKYEQAFKAKIDKIVTLPQSQSLKNVIDTIPRSAQAQKFHLSGFTGLYAEQLQNITFDGELAQTVETLDQLDNYLNIDAQIRQLYRSGKIVEAITLCTGNNQGQSNWAFVQYKVANEKLRLINEQAFNNKITSGFDRLNNFEIIACLSIGGIIILIFLGIRPRLREYSDLRPI